MKDKLLSDKAMKTEYFDHVKPMLLNQVNEIFNVSICCLKVVNLKFSI